MKIIALDIGDVHTGVAYADDTNLIAIPYRTVQTHELCDWFAKLIAQEPITTVIVGYPKTMRGGQSAQTLRTVASKEVFEERFPHIRWLLIDERLTSKQAQSIMRETKSNKKKEHEIAAAIILQTYLNSLN